MTSTIPVELAGRSLDCDFGSFVPRLTFSDNGLRVEVSTPDIKIDEVVDVDVTTVRPRVFAMSWTERSGNFIVQVQDHEKLIVHNYARLSDGQLFCMQGSLRAANAG